MRNEIPHIYFFSYTFSRNKHIFSRPTTLLPLLSIFLSFISSLYRVFLHFHFLDCRKIISVRAACNVFDKRSEKIPEVKARLTRATEAMEYITSHGVMCNVFDYGSYVMCFIFPEITASDILPLLQIYAGSFFAIPLIRWFFIRNGNAKIEKRNRAQQQRAQALELLDISLRRKLLSAAFEVFRNGSMARETKPGYISIEIIIATVEVAGRPSIAASDGLALGGVDGLVNSFKKIQRRDSNLELLARSRRRKLHALKIDKCSGFSTDGLLHISRSCSGLKSLLLEEISIVENDGKWLYELALNNTVLEALNFYITDFVKISFEDLELTAKNCRSLVSIKVSDCEILDLLHLFRTANALEEFCRGSFNEHPGKYSSLLFSPKLCHLGLTYMGKNEMLIVFPYAPQLKKVDLLYALLDIEDHCMSIQRSPNSEILDTNLAPQLLDFLPPNVVFKPFERGREQGSNIKSLFDVGDGLNYSHFSVAGLLIVAIRVNVSLSLALEVLQMIAGVIKDYFGVLNEDLLHKSWVLVYELLEEVIDFGLRLTDEEIESRVCASTAPVYDGCLDAYRIKKKLASAIREGLKLNRTLRTRCLKGEDLSHVCDYDNRDQTHNVFGLVNKS